MIGFVILGFTGAIYCSTGCTWKSGDRIHKIFETELSSNELCDLCPACGGMYLTAMEGRLFRANGIRYEMLGEEVTNEAATTAEWLGKVA